MAVNNSIKVGPLFFFVLNVCNHGQHYETPCMFVTFNTCNKPHLFVSTNWLFTNIIGVHIIFYCLLTVIVRRRFHTFLLFPYYKNNNNNKKKNNKNNNNNFMQHRFTEGAGFSEVTSALHEGIKYYKAYIIYYASSIHNIHQTRCNNYN